MKLLLVVSRYCPSCDIHVTVEVSYDPTLTSADLLPTLRRNGEARVNDEMHQHWLEKHAHILDTPRGALLALKEVSRGFEPGGSERPLVNRHPR